jgi:dTDP-4-dehydrorhamnose 3,5-epimerase
MHLQIAPHEEAKLVRVTRGAIFDVALDLRPDSARFREWVGFRLDADNRRALYVPEGVAHGFLTLEDDSEVFYQMSHPHAPTSARGFRHDDPAFGIEWPEPVVHISDRDRSHASFETSALTTGSRS